MHAHAFQLMGTPSSQCNLYMHCIFHNSSLHHEPIGVHTKSPPLLCAPKAQGPLFRTPGSLCPCGYQYANICILMQRLACYMCNTLSDTLLLHMALPAVCFVLSMSTQPAALKPWPSSQGPVLWSFWCASIVLQ
jgi:hypothetical protein